MSGDDELRRRLQGIPAPTARLDADAVIAGARKRRRPKTVALSSAATVAGVLIIAPFVVPGLSPLQPTGSSVSSDAGAAPESAPESAQEQEPAAEPGTTFQHDESAEGDGGDAGASDTGASGGGDAGVEQGDGGPGTTIVLDASATWCGLTPAGDAGLALRMLEEPVMSGPGSGFVQVEVTNLGDSAVGLELEPVTTFEISTIDSSARGGEAAVLALEPGEAAVLDAPTAVLPRDVCGDGTPSADVPLAIVALDGADPIGIVGSPWE